MPSLVPDAAAKVRFNEPSFMVASTLLGKLMVIFSATAGLKLVNNDVWLLLKLAQVTVFSDQVCELLNTEKLPLDLLNTSNSMLAATTSVQLPRLDVSHWIKVFISP